jgi:hypothetical protein
VSVDRDSDSSDRIVVANLSQLEPDPVPGHVYIPPRARIAIADRWAAAHRPPRTPPPNGHTMPAPEG